METPRFVPIKHTVTTPRIAPLEDIVETWWGFVADNVTTVGVTESQQEIEEICELLNKLDLPHHVSVAIAYDRCVNIAKKRPYEP